jgi:hypothetical protein
MFVGPGDELRGLKNENDTLPPFRTLDEEDARPDQCKQS